MAGFPFFVLKGKSMSSRLGVIANLALAVLLGPVAAQALETRIEYELGEASRSKMVLAQAWWTVAGQTGAQLQERPATPSRQPRRRPLISRR